MKKTILFTSLIIICLACSFLFLMKIFDTAKKNNNDDPIIEEPINNEESITKNKTAIFFGDSITKGYSSNGYSWSNFIKENYDLSDCINAGISDYRVSTYDDANKWLGTQVINHYNDKDNYDFVIMHGGINDLFYDTPIGKISNSFELSSFDSNTFIGGLEAYIYKAINKWPNARIGYIINYYTPKYSERNITWSINQYKVYYDSIKEVLNKWNISYIDLSEDKYSEILEINTTKYLPDKLHLNVNGYKVISPYIYDWMKTLKNYSK